MVPPEIFSADSVKYFWEAAPGTLIYRQLNLFFNFRVIVTPGLIIKTASTDMSSITGNCNA